MASSFPSGTQMRRTSPDVEQSITHLTALHARPNEKTSPALVSPIFIYCSSDLRGRRHACNIKGTPW